MAEVIPFPLDKTKKKRPLPSPGNCAENLFPQQEKKDKPEVPYLPEIKRTKEAAKALARHEQCLAEAQARDSAWKVFSGTVEYVKSGKLKENQARAIVNMLTIYFGIKPEETAIDDMTRIERDIYAAPPGADEKDGGQIILSLTAALQQKLIAREQALRIVKVIMARYDMDGI